MNKEKLIILIEKLSNKKVKESLKMLFFKELKDINESLFIECIYRILQECIKAETYEKIIDLICCSEEVVINE